MPIRIREQENISILDIDGRIDINSSELIEMVNDAVRTHLEVPERYLPFMPTYRPPLTEATRLGLIPTKKKGEIKLELYDGAEVACPPSESVATTRYEKIPNAPEFAV